MRSHGNEQFDDVVTTKTNCIIKSTVSVAVSSVYCSSIFQQVSHRLHVTLSTGDVQRRTPVCVSMNKLRTLSCTQNTTSHVITKNVARNSNSRKKRRLIFDCVWHSDHSNKIHKRKTYHGAELFQVFHVSLLGRSTRHSRKNSFLQHVFFLLSQLPHHASLLHCTPKASETKMSSAYLTTADAHSLCQLFNNGDVYTRWRCISRNTLHLSTQVHTHLLHTHTQLNNDYPKHQLIYIYHQ